MKKAILYCRVSTEEQVHGYSLPNQEDYLRAYCSSRDIEIRALYKEDHSAKSFDRPVFQGELLPYVKSNRHSIDLMLVVRWDRFSRDITDALIWIRRFKSWGIKVDATEEPVDLSIPQNKYMLAFYLTHPEVENDIRAANTREGMTRAVREGRWVSRPSIGYTMERDSSGRSTLVPNDQAPFVKESFRLVATGEMTFAEVHRHLVQRGFKAKRNQFYRMLDWYPYCGLIPGTDGESSHVRGIHEPLVSEELFYRVQEIRQERRGRKDVPKKLKMRTEFPLRGHLNCPECGQLLTASSSRGRSGKRYGYYHCHHGCKVRHKSEHVNAKVVDYLASFNVKPEVAELYLAIMKDVFEEREGERAKQATLLDREIVALEEKSTKAADKLVEGELDAQAYGRLSQSYERRRASLVVRRGDIGTNSTNYLRYMQSGLSLLTNLAVVYTGSDVAGRQRILGSIFPERLAFDGQRFRTGRPNVFVDLICNGQKEINERKKKRAAISGSPFSMVARTGFEPVLPA